MTDLRYTLLTQGQTVLANNKTDQELIKLAGNMAVYIGRANGRYHLPQSPWHNPFKVTKDTANEQAVAQYRDYLLAFPELLSQIEELRGKLLVCWCYPKPCHGDVLIELLAEIERATPAF